MPELDLFKEADRQLTICNACRYCEGYCAVFPAIELRRDFEKGDVLYLANLCHDCRACYYACMYSPPHEFAINIPKMMADVRVASYRRWSWPDLLARSFANRWAGIALAISTVALVVILSGALVNPAKMFASHRGPGSFYDVIPYLVIVIAGGTLFFSAISIWLLGSVRFWLEAGAQPRRPLNIKGLAAAVGDALGLRNLKGGGPGCSYPEEKPSSVRRIYHYFVSWGFLSAFLSTSLAAIYQDWFGWLPPYSLRSGPVILGSVGGGAMIIGTIGLLWFKTRSDLAPAPTRGSSLDYIFLGILGLVSLTGMLTLAFRSTPAMGSMLTVHLGLVAAMFVTAPYGKFVHFLYRSLALVKYHVEQNLLH
ncbi:MAG: tricarballylate utilization 4Fe-4S protein TcuB [Candidatus Acidiferrales bacterium]